jgi:hypothetical protein
VAISSNGAPVFPYNIGRGYYGSPTGGIVGSIAEAVVTNFLGGPKLAPVLNSSASQSGTVVLTWSALEGGKYRVESSTDLRTWSTNASGIASVVNSGSYTNDASSDHQFFRVAQTELATYDPVFGVAGGETAVAPGGNANRGLTVTITITLPTNPPLPPANNIPISVTLAGSIAGTSIARPSQGTAQATFTIPANAPTGPQTIVVVFSPAPTYTMNSAFTIN